MLERVAHYNLLELVGVGGMGEVCRARDTRLGRTVAVKVLPDTIARDAALRERFLRDARAATVISHPNIAALFDVVEEGDDLCLVFEYVPGRSLAAEIGGRPMSMRVALELAVQLADAVADAHAAGILHRDLKPDNVIITPKGRAKILDFGLADWTRGGAAREAAVTQLQAEPGVVMGTLAYMSPEQASGGPVDERSDIFSLGIVIFEMLTGRNPFARPGAGLLAATAIVRDPAPAPSQTNRRLPPELDEILARALAKEPEARYQSAATLAAELRSLVAILDVRDGDSDPSPLVPHIEERRLPWGWILAALVVVALAVGVWTARDRLAALWGRYAGPAPPPILAVVPEAAEPNQRYVADGLAEDVASRLGQTPGIQVVRRSAMRLPGGVPPAAVAEALGAKAVLTLSVRRVNDRLRVDASLLDPARGAELWRQQFDRPVRDVFAVEVEIAEAVAGVFNLAPPPSALLARMASRAVDERAYDLYLRARDAGARGDARLAAGLYGEAVKADPSLAEAYAGLAEETYREAAGAGDFCDPSVLARTRAAAGQAAALDPDLPRAYLALGLGATTLADGLTSLSRATSLDHSYARAYAQIGHAIVGIDPAKSRGYYHVALLIDPGADPTWSGAALAYLGSNERDRTAMMDLLQKSPAHRRAPVAEWLEALEKGDATRALELSGSPGGWADPSTSIALALLYARTLHLAERRDEALALMEARMAGAPEFCEGRAVLGGLLVESGAADRGALMLRALVSSADAADAPASVTGCAATAAAALGEPVRAGQLLRRIAERDDALWCRALEAASLLGDLPVQLRLYPWRLMADRPPVRAAMDEIQTAYGRLRDTAGGILDWVKVGSEK